ncbi:MAG: 3-(3-hydroxyphenyl)propionate hydroxylase [Rhodobacteraceae bacterium]|nr:3-(3-hydroxyphenyl)propionate hydroxylase [Paracoccaceae bacterium]MAY47427.1 3-(3-hydroxyphenyl)propionate hydroxylase [Paracoccaceae bacterium]
MVAYPQDIPVVIIGGGPAGLTCANLLATWGVDFILLEREARPLNLPRAIVLDDEGARTIQTFGLHRTYLQQARPGIGSRYYDDTGICFAETGAGPRTYGFAKRHYMFQPEFEDALRAELDARVPGRIRFNSNVIHIAQDGTGARVTLTGEDGGEHTIATHWVLACDGGRSPTREALGIAMQGNTYEADWIVVDTMDDPDDTLFSKFYCSTTRPMVSVPAPHGGRRYEFMLLPGETREEVLEDGFLETLMAPFRAYDPAKIIRKTVYTFHARLADRFRQGRILLVGDAAHLTPPFAGQGMNAGLRDAHNVTWKIAAVEQGGADAAILDSYEAERRDPAWSMIQLAVAMGEIVMPVDPEQMVFRRLLLKALDPFPNVRDYLIQMRFKPKPRYDRGLFLGLDAPEFEASLVGEMLPQPTLDTPDGPVLMDEALGSGFALIAQCEAGRQAIGAVERTTLCGLPLGTLSLRGARFADPDTARPIRTHRDQVMLIRPDRYCAAAVAPEDLGAMLEAYEASLGLPNARTDGRPFETA